MHYAKIFYCDIANGAGVRTALFVSGCTHHCKECFNPETWDFDYGEKYTFFYNSYYGKNIENEKCSVLINNS